MSLMHKSRTVTEAQLRRLKTKKEKQALNQNEFQKGWIKVLTILSYFHVGVRLQTCCNGENVSMNMMNLWL